MERSLANMNVKEMVYFSTKLSKVFRHKIITYNKAVQHLIQQRNDAYEYYIKNNKNCHLFENF